MLLIVMIHNITTLLLVVVHYLVLVAISYFLYCPPLYTGYSIISAQNSYYVLIHLQ